MDPPLEGDGSTAEAAAEQTQASPEPSSSAAAAPSPAAAGAAHPSDAEFLIHKHGGMLGIILGPDLIVKGVRDESGAQSAGLRPGMKIHKVCGSVVTTLDEYLSKVWGSEDWVDIVVDLERSVVMASNNRLARQAAKQWACYLCNGRNPPYTADCRQCSRANPLKGEAESRCRKISIKKALGEHLSQEEQEDFEILTSLLSTSAGDFGGTHKSIGSLGSSQGGASAGPSPVSSPTTFVGTLSTTPRLLSFKAKAVSGSLMNTLGLGGGGSRQGVGGEGGDPDALLTWTRSEDNRVRELRSRKEAVRAAAAAAAAAGGGSGGAAAETPAPAAPSSTPLTEDEEEELRQLEEGFTRFIDQGVRHIHATPKIGTRGGAAAGGGAISKPAPTQQPSAMTWSRDEDNMFRNLSIQRDAGQLSDSDTAKLEELSIKYNAFIAEGLELMKKGGGGAQAQPSGGDPAAGTPQKPKRTSLIKLWGGGEGKKPQQQQQQQEAEQAEPVD